MKQEKVLSLIKAFVSGDKRAIDTQFCQLLADFDDKSSHTVKSSFEYQYKTFKNGTGKLIELPQRLKQFIFESYTPAHMTDLVLPEDVVKTVMSLEKEYKHRKVLRDNGLTNTNRVLLIGPPGNGKTSFAVALAEQLSITPYIVATSLLIDSHLGESGHNITSLIKDVPSGGLLFIDEFDTLASARGTNDQAAGRECNNIVNSILMALDRLDKDVILVAATNRDDLLDSAIKRRFDAILRFPSPSRGQIDHYVENYQKKYEVSLNITPQELYEYNSYSGIEKVLKKRHKELILKTILLTTNNPSTALF